METRRRVLDALARGPVNGAALAAELGVSRAAVWKHVEALRAAGFEIQSTAAGYEVREVPEYGALGVLFGLAAPFEVEYHEVIGSTNDRARELAGAGRSNVAVLADEQTGGRGRRGRGWMSPPGGVWMSVVVRPELPPAQVGLLTLGMGVAVTEAARAEGVRAEMKWPNDVLVPEPEGGARKLAGILTELEGEADRVSWVVVGVGVNANGDPAALPTGAVGFRELCGGIDRRVFVQRLLERFDELRGDPGGIVGVWRGLAGTLGRRVRVETARGRVVGEAVDVAVDGALVVETQTGRERVHAGECEHLRAV